MEITFKNQQIKQDKSIMFDFLSTETEISGIQINANIVIVKDILVPD